MSGFGAQALALRGQFFQPAAGIRQGLLGVRAALALQAQLPLLRTGWIGGAVALMAASGIFFAARVAPLQRKLHAMAAQGARTGSFDLARYRAVALAWEAWGAAALLTPVAARALLHPPYSRVAA